ncbi:MAG: ABC transporter permease subunit [Clostridiales bacterium]|nr:ABC transporter permease subunit [Clostridiales bacterium]
MSSITLEFYKEKRTGAFVILIAAGVLGSFYTLLNYALRKEVLLSLPLPLMDVLLTQLYGMIMILNLFGIILATCIVYHTEYQGNAIKKMYTLPISIAKLFHSKFIILSTMLLIAIIFENIALTGIGLTVFPHGNFNGVTLIIFAAYSYITSMPVLTFMLLVSSRFENIWVSFGIGIAGFLSGMALATLQSSVFVFHPFVLMFYPAIAMSSQPDSKITVISLLMSAFFYSTGMWLSNKVSSK